MSALTATSITTVFLFLSVLPSIQAFSPPGGCDSDTFECTNNGGFSVYRNPDNKCQFYDCQLKCCDENNKPPRHEGLQCCGLTGQWVSSIGNGRTFYCGGVEATGPKYSAPFWEPCPVACTLDAKLCPDGSAVGRDPKKNCEFSPCPSEIGCPDDVKICDDGTEFIRDDYTCEFPACSNECKPLLRKRDCLASKGCRWLYRDRKCLAEIDASSCNVFDRRKNCNQFSKCKWKRQETQCKPKCNKPDPNTICAQQYDPVTCKGQCTFSNQCVALAAGYKKRQCRKTCSTKKDCPSPDSQICYKEINAARTGICVNRDIESSCDGLLGEECPIGNRCVNDPDDGCNPPFCADGGGVCISFGCRKPKKQSSCDDEFNPVVCGKNSCTYRNKCLASASGIKDIENKCKPYCPRSSHLLSCGPDYIPGFRCGECVYSSLCRATSVGFTQEQCVKDDTTPNCELVLCDVPICQAGQVPETPDGQCCPTCLEEATTTVSSSTNFDANKKDQEPKKDYCDDIVCPPVDCEDGYYPVEDPNGCCEKCALLQDGGRM